MIALVVLIVLFAAEIAGYIFELHKHTLASQALMVCLTIFVPLAFLAFLYRLAIRHAVKLRLDLILIQIILIPPLVLAIHYWKTGKNYIDDVWRILGFIISIVACALIVYPFEKWKGDDWPNRAASYVISLFVFGSVFVHIEITKAVLKSVMTS